MNNIASLRKKAAQQLEIRLRAICEIIREEQKRDDFCLELEVELSKLDQSDHIIELMNRLAPEKVVLYLADEQQPWLAKYL
jgi:histidinol dehydrogenase